MNPKFWGPIALFGAAIIIIANAERINHFIANSTAQTISGIVIVGFVAAFILWVAEKLKGH